MTVSEFQQFVTVVSGFALKPAYMALSFFLAASLRKADDSDLVLIRYSLISFFAGELACAMNYFLTSGAGEALEVMHGLGMVGMWILLPWGLYRFFDRRIIRFSDTGRACAFQAFCAKCHKNGDHPCGVRRIFLFLAPALALVSLIPLTRGLAPYDYLIPIFGTPTRFASTAAVQFIELRAYPIVAAVLFLSSFAVLLNKKKGLELAPAVFFPGLGFMSFSLFRFFFSFAFEGFPVWYNFWEEATELVTVAALGLFLWIFRRQFRLFTGDNRHEQPDMRDRGSL